MTAKQAELAARYGIATPYPEDVTLPPPELFPKRPAWAVRKQDGMHRLDTMSWGFPHTITGKSGKPIAKAVTNVPKPLRRPPNAAHWHASQPPARL